MSNTTSRSRGVPVTTAVTGPSLLWRFLASSWLVLLLFPAGALAWLGFGILAIIARRRAWTIIAVAYAVAAIAVQLPVGALGEIAQGTLYLIALGHGLIVNQRWLLLLWSRTENGLTLLGRPARRKPPQSAAAHQRSAPVPKEAEELLGSGGTSRSDYVAGAAPAPAPRRRRLTRAERRAQTANPTAEASAPTAEAATAAELIDVNTANQRTLARLTGIDRALAKNLFADRTKRGGFGSLEDFAASAGLQPHQIVRLRGEAFCSPRPRSARSFGRRVDY